jgi:hypothetical protein
MKYVRSMSPWTMAAGKVRSHRLAARLVRLASALPVLGALVALTLAATAHADIEGRVYDIGTDAPIEGAVVSIRSRPELGRTVSGPDGRFLLPLDNPTGDLSIGAALPYDAAREHNYLTQSFQVFDGMKNLQVGLTRSPANQDTTYEPPSTQTCRSCHGNYHSQWSSSRHAGSAVNEWVLDLYAGTGTPGGSAGYVFRDTHDAHETGFCATCHAPLEDVFAPGEVFLDEVSTTAGLEGVSCLGCHQISDVSRDHLDALHHLGKTTYRFPEGGVDTYWYVWGPLPDVEGWPMQAHYSPLHSDPLLCASCHQYSNPDTGAPGQNTYREWLASPYAKPGPEQRTCQNCHMPKETSGGIIGSHGPMRPASQRTTHRFIGATPERLTENIHLRISTLQEGAQLVVTAEVENQCGHNFPTGISIRNAMVLLDVRVDGEPLAQTRGPVLPFWASDDVPGVQPGDYAGLPGKGFAKVLQGRINGEGPVQQPVLFIDAEAVLSDTGIPSGSTDVSEYRFAIPPGLAQGAVAQVDARLLYRRAWRALAVTKGWTQTPGGMPVEIEVQRAGLQPVLEPVGDLIYADGFDAPQP